MQRICDGLCAIEKDVQIKNMLPKNHEISSVSGEIILKKDEDFDIFCFDINFDGNLSARVRLWPINSPCTSPATPDSDSDSDDSGYDCHM